MNKLHTFTAKDLIKFKLDINKGIYKLKFKVADDEFVEYIFNIDSEVLSDINVDKLMSRDYTCINYYPPIDINI